MIDVEQFEKGKEVWFVHQNRLASFISHTIKKYNTTSGFQINIIGSGYDIPADWCYYSKIECIEAQVNYWRDMRLNEIVKDSA